MTMQPTDREKQLSEIIMPTDKSKEIRDKWFMEWGLNPNVRPDSMFPLTASDIQTIQSETYQLGREEVINKLAGWAVRIDGGEGIALNDFLVKLNELKESK